MVSSGLAAIADRPGLPRPERGDQADRARRPGQAAVFLAVLVHVTVDLANYLVVAAEPVVTGGGGIMFHVSARYFQFAPSCTMTLI